MKKQVGMKVWAATIGLLGFTACSEAFTTNVTVVARSGDAELTVNRLAEIVATAPDIPIQREVIELLAFRWVELAAWAQRAAAGDSLIDSTLIMEAMWPDTRGAVVDSFLALRWGELDPVEPAQVDSAYRSGQLRMIAHVLKRVTDSMTPEQKAAKKTEAERLWATLENGGTWAQINAANDDEVARQQGGLLGILRRGATVPQFENVAFALGSGEVSPVTETQYGYHIIFRPPLADVREPFTAAVEAAFRQRADSAYEQELLSASRVEFRPEAPAAIREAARWPVRMRQSEKVLATFDGGRFTVRDFIRWLHILPMEIVQRIDSASDEQLGQLARSLVTRELIWRAARERGLELSPERYQAIADSYRSQIAELQTATQVYPDSLADFRPTLKERSDVAMLLIERYLEQGTKNTSLFIPVPPFLGERLLDETDWEVDQRGIDRVVARATDLRESLPASEEVP